MHSHKYLKLISIGAHHSNVPPPPPQLTIPSKWKTLFSINKNKSKNKKGTINRNTQNQNYIYHNLKHRQDGRHWSILLIWSNSAYCNIWKLKNGANLLEKTRNSCHKCFMASYSKYLPASASLEKWGKIDINQNQSSIDWNMYNLIKRCFTWKFQLGNSFTKFFVIFLALAFFFH